MEHIPSDIIIHIFGLSYQPIVTFDQRATCKTIFNALERVHDALKRAYICEHKYIQIPSMNTENTIFAIEYMVRGEFIILDPTIVDHKYLSEKKNFLYEKSIRFITRYGKVKQLQYLIDSQYFGNTKIFLPFIFIDAMFNPPTAIYLAKILCEREIFRHEISNLITIVMTFWFSSIKSPHLPSINSRTRDNAFINIMTSFASVLEPKYQSALFGRALGFTPIVHYLLVKCMFNVFRNDVNSIIEYCKNTINQCLYFRFYSCIKKIFLYCLLHDSKNIGIPLFNLLRESKIEKNVGTLEELIIITQITK